MDKKKDRNKLAMINPYTNKRYLYPKGMVAENPHDNGEYGANDSKFGFGRKNTNDRELGAVDRYYQG